MLLGKNLKRLRAEKNLTQEELAKRLNVSRSTLAYWELGQRSPDYATLIKIAKYFNVTTDYLLGKAEAGYYSENPTDAEIEEILKRNDIYFRDMPLDDEDKKDILDVIRLILKRKQGVSGEL